MKTLLGALVVCALALAGCRAGAREGLPPAPPYGALSNQPTPKAAPGAQAAVTLGRIEYYQISDG